MGYPKVTGRRPFERASKIAHTEVLNNPVVREFVAGCTLPAPPGKAQLASRIQDLPQGDDRIRAVIAVDGGLTEVSVRDELPSASIAFMTFGPLLLSLDDLAEVDKQPFIGPEDMARFRNLQRYTFVVPSKGVRAPGAASFCEGVRKSVFRFLSETEPDLIKALQWLLFREWLPENRRQPWRVSRCPSSDGRCGTTFDFRSGGPTTLTCPSCKREVYLSDGLRLYERIDEEQGAGGIMAYLLTTVEQLVVVHLLKSVLEMKPSLLREVLIVKDGPLAFFGVTAPLCKPMQELMQHLGTLDNGKPMVNLIGLEKSGPFVEHAKLIEPHLKDRQLIMLGNDYIYKYIQPGDPRAEPFGRNTYYGAKLIFKGAAQDTYVATIPVAHMKSEPTFDELFNAAEVLATASRLRCSMYDNALVPIVLANRLVSLADVPSSEILAKFARRHVPAEAT